MMIKKIHFILLLMFTSLFAHAQSAEVGAWLGGINSFNDLNSNTSFATIRPAGGIIGKYNFDSRVGVELMAGYGTAFSKDAAYETDTYQENRNAGSKTRTIDIQIAGEFNFLPFGESRTSQFTPYATAGIGVTNAKTLVYSRLTSSYVSATTINAEDGEDFKQMMVNVPIGAGVKYKLNDKFHLAGEFASRILFNDYYDGFSTQYTQTGIDSNPGTLNNLGIQRGDRSRNDSYNFLSAQITYVIPMGKCW